MSRVLGGGGSVSLLCEVCCMIVLTQFTAMKLPLNAADANIRIKATLDYNYAVATAEVSVQQSYNRMPYQQ